MHVEFQKLIFIPASLSSHDSVVISLTSALHHRQTIEQDPFTRLALLNSVSIRHDHDRLAQGSRHHQSMNRNDIEASEPKDLLRAVPTAQAVAERSRVRRAMPSVKS
jgi:hypothetical protein